MKGATMKLFRRESWIKPKLVNLVAATIGLSVASIIGAHFPMAEHSGAYLLGGAWGALTVLWLQFFIRGSNNSL